MFLLLQCYIKMKQTTVFISLGILLTLLTVAALFNYNYYENKVYDVGDDVKIDSNNLKTLVDSVPEGEFVVCSMEADKCTTMKKVALT